MDTKKLRQKILDLAIHGKLVPQDPNDEPASVLLERIRAEKERLIAEGKIKRSKKSATSDTSHYENVPFEVPEGWSWCTLDELTTSIGDGLHGTPKFDDNGEYYFVNGNNLDGIISIKKETKRTTIDEYTKQGLKFNSQTIFVSINGTLGNIAFYNNEPIVLGKSACYINLLDSISKEYIATILRCQYFINYCRDTATGSTIKNVPLAAMRTLFIPIPSYQEQLRIVDEVEKLLSLVDLLDENTNELGNAITVARSKILDLAIHGKLVPQDTNDEPASELLKRINPKAVASCDNPQYGKMPFEIPNSWLWLSHNDILEISGGSQPAKSYFKETPENGYIRLYQIRDYGEHPVPVYIPIELASKTTQKGDILLARYGGSLGKVFIAEDGAYNVAMAKVILKFEHLLDKEFVYFYYLSKLYQDKLQTISRTAQAGFNSSDFEDMYFPLPPIEEQQRIVHRIKSLYLAIDNIQKSLEV